MPKNFFTFSLIALVLLAGLLVAVEKMLAWKGDGISSGSQRFIRLRENQPNSYNYYVPTSDELEQADSLAVKQYAIKIDAEGFVLPSTVHDNPEADLVFSGGSTTACYYMAEEKRFPFLAGRLLEQQTGRSINSYNSGVGGNDSLSSLNILINKILPLQPNCAVLMHNINDLTVLLFENSYWSDNPSRSPIVEMKSVMTLKGLVPALIPQTYAETKKIEKNIRRWRDRVLGRSTSVDQEKAKDEFQHVRGKKITIAQEALLKEFGLNLQTFVNICLAGKITPVLMTQPNRLKESPDPVIQRSLASIETQHGISYRDYKTIYDCFNQHLREVAARNQIPLIDLAQTIPPEKEYMYDIVHLTECGSEAAAELITKKLLPLVIRTQPKQRSPVKSAS